MRGVNKPASHLTDPQVRLVDTHETRAVLLHCRVADFAPVPLVFAWSRLASVPLLLGQVNFFEAFDVCFYRARRQFEIEPARR